MGSPSSGPARIATLPLEEKRAELANQHEQATVEAVRADSVLIAGFGSPIAAEYAGFVSQQHARETIVIEDKKTRSLVDAPVRSLAIEELLRSPQDHSRGQSSASSLVLFIGSRLTYSRRRELDELLEIARRRRTRFIAIVSTFRVHLDDRCVAETELFASSRAAAVAPRVVVFRPGHVLSRQSGISNFLDRFAAFYPLFPRRLSSCFVLADELFSAIESERLAGSGQDGHLLSRQKDEPTGAPRDRGRLVDARCRAISILGPNRPWRDMLLQHRKKSTPASVMAAISLLLSWLFVGQGIAFLLNIVARQSRWLRQWTVQVLKPHSLRELLSLCHRYNIQNVKVVGYNNGVNHFGHRHPGKTVVSTVLCRRTACSGPNIFKADCGTTVRNALDFLAPSHQELYVVPNYSYVCLGTAFFVPIHGSAVDYSTVVDTISRVVFYDPESDRIVSAARDDHAFREHVYNMRSPAVVLRLHVLTKPKSAYFIQREILLEPSAGDLLKALRDPSAANVEIRQVHAASTRVTVSRYYTTRPAATELNADRPDRVEKPPGALELPRDSLGRLWDRLEVNPVSSYVMHAVGRHVVWHTELFMNASEFELFWRTHSRLPLRKIQLRYLRRDGLPHSPCRDEDRVSADLFLFRTQSARFLDYLRTILPAVPTNPGKHSH
jgi:hypothetical protein